MDGPNMDGANLDGVFDPAWRSTQASDGQVEGIRNAMNATLNPRTPHDIRSQALEYLDQVKGQANGPHIGFTLADNLNGNDAVRYYGLQLLEHAIKYWWAVYGDVEQDQLIRWVTCLAGSIQERDAIYLRNKIGQLWVEVAKRSWGDRWMNMDKQLVSLWDRPLSEKGTVNKTLVLYILETLSDDITNKEDAAAGLRMHVLGNALNDIMIPTALYTEFDDVSKAEKRDIRFGEDGWLKRISLFFSECVRQAAGGDGEWARSMSFCAMKTLHALRPTMAWINMRATVEVDILDCLYQVYQGEDIVLQTVTTEVLYALLRRPCGHWWEPWIALMEKALQSDRIGMLRITFDRANTRPGQDDERYTLQKKLSELVASLAENLAKHAELSERTTALPGFFELLLQIFQSNSLLVSLPVLYGWTQLMAVRENTIVDFVIRALGALVETCSARLLRFEAIPENESDDEIILFLSEDFDTVPERHAFLGNYRRYCFEVIQAIARMRPLEVLSHVLGQLREMLETGPYTSGRGFDSAMYSKTNLSVLQFDAQYSVVATAIKGYSQWLKDIATLPPEDEAHAKVDDHRTSTIDLLQQWSYKMINTHSDDPEVAAQVLQTLVLILRTIKPEPAFVLNIVQHLLTMRLYDNPSHTTFSDAVKSFEAMRVLELQKLALNFSNELLEVYHELEPRVGVLVQKHSDDPRLVWGYKAFLFMIVHRASGINNEVRLARLQQMLQPVYEAWQSQTFTNSCASLQAFCDSLGMSDLAEFYSAYNFAEVTDWAAQQLDAAGQERQAVIKAKSDESPLRMTKSMLAATIEQMKAATDEFEIACALWNPMIPIMLPNLLQMLRHAEAFHNMSNWSQLPHSLQGVMKRTLQDRFWQSGISNESKDEFYARISGSKTSYEGFASVVRGTMRSIREQGYHIIYLMTKFDEQFYGLPNLSEPLAEALFADAGSLTANHLSPIINLTTGLVQRCPPHRRGQFLPPLLIQLFNKLDAKISSEWEAIEQATQHNAEDDELTDEMRTESVLRQLTYSMVSFVSLLLPQEGHGGHANGDGEMKPTLRDIVLSDPTILEPLMMFCTHALRMRDTRCCTAVCKIFRALIPLFQSNDSPAPQVREFICSEVLKAGITSLNEPYFADIQKELSALIAQIILVYAPSTSTPRDILLSLPDMSETKVDKAIARICKMSSERQLRSVVLDLLEGVRGVSIHEAGKITSKKTAKKTTVPQQYMEVEQRPTIVNGDDTGLEDVAGLFGDA